MNYTNDENIIKKPLATLKKAINKNVLVRLKNDVEYTGKMTNVDVYMNVILINAEEYENGSMSANFGKVIIRGNNVLFINIRPDIPL